MTPADNVPALWPAPCAKGLTRSCFEQYPRWARRMLAYRLLCLFLDCTKTDILQRLHAELLEPPAPPEEPEPPPGGWPPPDPPPGGWPPPDPPPGETLPPEPPGGWPPPDPPPGGWPPPEPPPGGWPTAEDPPTSPTEYYHYIGPADGGLDGPRGLGLLAWEPGPPKPPVTSPTAGLALIYSEPGDGYIRDSDSTWQIAHDHLAGDQIRDTEKCYYAPVYSYNGEPAYGQIKRAFFTFDLKDIPATKTVRSAELWIYGYQDAAANVTVQISAHHDPLIVADYSAFSGTYLARDTWALGPNNLTFRPSGINYLQTVLGGLAKFCLREFDHDYQDTLPPQYHSHSAGMCFSQADDPTQRPYLVINYS